MTQELKPCPFCGARDVTAYHHQIEGWEESWHVECNADNCGNGTCHHETEAEAITSWNQRHEPLRASHDALVEALEGLVGDITGLIEESHGVAGLHMNGDIAEWESLLPGGRFEEWLLSIDEARAALNQAQGGE